MKILLDLLKLTVVASLGASSLAVVATHPANAAIIGSQVLGGYRSNDQHLELELKIIEPPKEGIILRNFDNFSSGSYTIDPNPNPAIDLFGIYEKQQIVLPESINVWDRWGKERSSNPNVTIPKDTLVSSYLFYVNPPGGDAPTSFKWSGHIQFDAPILGIVSRKTEETTRLLGLDDTKYELASGLDGHEVVTLEDNTLTFYIKARSGSEPFRVITSGTPTVSVPEPLTILGSGVALGFGVLFRKIKRR